MAFVFFAEAGEFCIFIAGNLSNDLNAVELTEVSQPFSVVAVEYYLVHTFYIAYIMYFVNGHFYICPTPAGPGYFRASCHLSGIDEHPGFFSVEV